MNKGGTVISFIDKTGLDRVGFLRGSSAYIYEFTQHAEGAVSLKNGYCQIPTQSYDPLNIGIFLPNKGSKQRIILASSIISLWSKENDEWTEKVLLNSKHYQVKEIQYHSNHIFYGDQKCVVEVDLDKKIDPKNQKRYEFGTSTITAISVNDTHLLIGSPTGFCIFSRLNQQQIAFSLGQIQSVSLQGLNAIVAKADQILFFDIEKMDKPQHSNIFKPVFSYDWGIGKLRRIEVVGDAIFVRTSNCSSFFEIVLKNQ